MRGQGHGHVALHSLQGFVGFRRRKIGKDGFDVRQQAPAAIERGNSVVEIRRHGLLRYGTQFDAVLRHRMAQRGRKVLGSQLCKWRHAEGCRPVKQQGVHFGHSAVLLRPGTKPMQWVVGHPSLAVEDGFFVIVAVAPLATLDAPGLPFAANVFQ